MKTLIFDAKITCWDRGKIELDDEDYESFMKRLNAGEFKDMSDVTLEFDLDWDDGSGLKIDTEEYMTLKQNEDFATFEVRVDNSDSTPIFTNSDKNEFEPPQLSDDQILMTLL